MTKFNAAWQLQRTKAKLIKNVDQKILFVCSYFFQNKTVQDKQRVLNWLNMTKVAYKENMVRCKFDVALNEVKQVCVVQDDNTYTLDDLTIEEVKQVYDDLKKRTYNFQFKKVPKDHIKFMELLERRIDEN